MFPRTIENRLKKGRYAPTLRRQSARIEPCGDGCIIKQGKVDGHIEIDLDVEKLEGKSGTATYVEIKKYVADHNDGMKITNLYIGQIKNKMGLEKSKNHNVGSGEGRVPTCPQDKKEVIVEAFKHFNLI